MPEGQEEIKPPEPNKVSPEILASLGLTEGDLDSFDEKLEREKYVDGLVEKGKAEYDKAKRGKEAGEQHLTVRGPRGIFISFPEPIIEGIPDSVIEELDKIYNYRGLEFEKLKRDEIIPELKAWLRGFGSRALELGDWRTAVASFDVATDGKVMDNPDLMAKLKEIATTDKTEGAKIAVTLQQRLEKRAAQASTPESAPTT